MYNTKYPIKTCGVTDKLPGDMAQSSLSQDVLIYEILY